MPNWCSNTATFKHTDPNMIKRAVDAFSAGKFLQEFVPQTCEPDDWYDWNVNNWGTKWDVGDSDGVVVIEPNQLVVIFDSAWAPPTAAYRVMEGLGFEIDAFYHEPGMGFAGRYHAGNDDYYEFGDMTPDEVKELLPTEIDEEFDLVEQLRQWQDEDEE